MYSIKLEKESLLPREKLVRNGAEQLSDQELLAIILRTGNKDKHVMELAANLLNTVSSLSDFKKMSLQELRQLVGIGNVKSIELKAMLEFSRRIQESEQTSQYQILSSFQIAKKMIKQLGDKEQEHLVALYLDTQNKVIEEKTIFIGSVRRSIAEPMEIMHYACRNMATSMIIVHNHPSGFVAPSENDYHFTKNIKQLCDQIGIACLDHIIVGKNNYYSFREKTNLFCE